MGTAILVGHDPLDPLDASLADFEPGTPSPYVDFSHQLKQHQHHIVRSCVKRGASEETTTSSHRHLLDEEEESLVASEDDEELERRLRGRTESDGGFSPPAWRRTGNGDRDEVFWRSDNNMLLRQHHGFGHVGAPSSSGYQDSAEDDRYLEAAIRTRLPGSMSPEKGRSPEPEDLTARITVDRLEPTVEEPEEEDAATPKLDNYIRFSLRADVQHRTEPIESFVIYARRKIQFFTGSWTSLFLSVLVALFATSIMRTLFQPPTQRPMPDLVKVAGIARSFEPLIYYSESGVQQVGDLQATGVAVWDLGESVRQSNMTSAPIIVGQLDELAETLKTLSLELTRFFANVDGDIDSIVIVIDWARRELAQLGSPPTQPLASVYTNIHNLLSDVGLLEDPASGQPTRLGTLTNSVLGTTHPQRARAALRRTFDEFLSVLEEAIESELAHSMSLFALFEAADRQFLNLARTVVRETAAQDEAHGELLSGLWTYLLGARGGQVRKYERNRRLLEDVRARTVRNKGVLVEHNGRLLTLKAGLESLRRKLVSPLLRSINSTTLSLDAQVRGLEDVGAFLEGVRKKQKEKMRDVYVGAGRKVGAAGAMYLDGDN